MVVDKGKVTMEFAPFVDSAFESPIRDFIDPDRELGLPDQLGVMEAFWRRLGYRLPEYGRDQLHRMHVNAEANPRLRVLPTPVLTGGERVALGVKALAFPNHHLNPDTPLRSPDAGTVYARLLDDQSSGVEREGDENYTLGYRTVRDTVVDRSSYLAELLRDGHALRTDDQGTWVTPMLDVRVYPERTGETAQDIYPNLDPILIPEALIAMQLIHQAAGVIKDRSRWDIDYANEAVCAIDPDGSARPVYFATVRLRTQDDRIGTYARRSDSQRIYAGFREAVNALADPR